MWVVAVFSIHELNNLREKNAKKKQQRTVNSAELMCSYL